MLFFNKLGARLQVFNKNWGPGPPAPMDGTPMRRGHRWNSKGKDLIKFTIKNPVYKFWRPCSPPPLATMTRRLWLQSVHTYEYILIHYIVSLPVLSYFQWTIKLVQYTWRVQQFCPCNLSVEMKINNFQHLCKQSLICTLERTNKVFMWKKNLKFKSPFFTISPCFRKK